MTTDTETMTAAEALEVLRKRLEKGERRYGAENPYNVEARAALAEKEN